MKARDQKNNSSRLLAAEAVALRAGMLALEYFRSAGLKRRIKGHQDFVSEADIKVETLIRETITTAFPEDGMIGEEDGLRAGTSGYTWVVDPIDGTTNFLDGLPGWVVSVAVLKGDVIEVGVIQDPCAGEIFTAYRGGGARLNGRLLPLLNPGDLSLGTVGVGFPQNTDPDEFATFLSDLLKKGGNFYRNGSAASMLAQVAAGRLVAAYQAHLNSWDCLAGLLLVEEAGGKVLNYDMTTMLEHGAPVLGAAPMVYEQILRLLSID